MKDRKHRNKLTEESYNQAVSLIDHDGFITRDDLLDLFRLGQTDSIESYFETEENPLYGEWVESTEEHNKNRRNKTKKMKIFKLFNEVKAQWKEDNRQNGKLNNSYNGNPNSIFMRR